MGQRLLKYIPALLVALLLSVVGCRQLPAQLSQAATSAALWPPMSHTLLPVRSHKTELVKPIKPCSNTFTPHTLDHLTWAGEPVRMFESNGTGLAINDLDNDGDQDVVLANLKDPNTILWNEGGLTFRKERLSHGDSRAVNVVDVDGDGWQDIVFTRRTSPPSFWRNTGRDTDTARFEELWLPDVDQRAYAMTWGDMDGDGDLDIVSASYDAALEKDLGYDFMRFRSGGGVYYYENIDAAFVGHHLAERSQALAIALPDFNQDGKADILIGNDFDMPDQAWQQQGREWVEVAPFDRTSHSTMSFDLGDIDNNGSPELFATDMKPYGTDIKTHAEWRPMMARMPHETFIGDPQIMENVLQIRDSAGRFHNHAYRRSLDATGWSWSGKFGDLNNDGFLDLYVVNGMLAADLFDYLPGNELSEQNQLFLNDGAGYFTRAPKLGLGSTASGRGMSMADLDNDGDLDIVVNNLHSPAILFENQLCGGASMEVDLVWPESKNTRALGGRLVLRTSSGVYYRDVRASSGYLSGDPARVHFGFAPGTELYRLEIHWPDGQVSSVEDVAEGTIATITR